MNSAGDQNSPEYKKGLASFRAKHPPSNQKLIDEIDQLSPELADVIIAHGIYPNNFKIWYFDKTGIPIFEAACIAQLIQVELFRRRFAASNMWRRLCQNTKF